MAYLLNIDRADGKPLSFLCEEANGLQRGQILEIKGMAQNNHWVMGLDNEAYKVELAGVDSELGNIAIHTSVPNQYDERLMEQDFILGEGQIGRMHTIVKGDEFTFAKELVTGGVVLGDKVALGANGTLAKVTADEVAIGQVVKLYNFGKQESVMIRFY